MRSCDSSGDVATATMDHRACGKEKESTADTKATAAAVEACATDSRFSCNICFEEVTEPVVTRCGHLYCWPCLFQWLEPGMHRHEREQLGMHIPHAAYYGSGNGDSSRRVCPVCKSECPVSSIVPVYVRSTSSSSPAVAAAATTTTTTVAASSSRSCFSHDDNDGNNNNSSSNSSREEEQQLIESSDENRSAANEPENDTNTNINNNGNHNTSNDSNAGEGLRRRRIQHRSPEHHANITNNINDGNNNNSNNNNNNNNNVRVPVPNRPSVAHVPAQQQQQPEPSSPPFSSRTSPGSTPRATPGNSYRVGGLQIAPRSPNGHNASLTHEILSSFQRATANSYRNSNNHNHNYANNNGNNEPDQQRQIPSLHDLNRNGTTGSFGGEQDGDNQRHINYTPASVIDVNSETTQYLSRLLIMLTSFVIFCFLLV